MNGTNEPPDRLPPPVVNATPTPLKPRPSGSARSPALIVIVLCAIAIGVLAYLYMRGPSGGGAQTKIPAEMGGTVPTAALNRLFDAAGKESVDAVGVRVSVGQGGDAPVYRIKDVLRVGYSVQRPALCTLFHRDAKGVISVIHPDAGDSPSMRAGEEWVSEELTVTEPIGRESFVAVCARHDDDAARVDLGKILAGSADQWGDQLSAVPKDFEVQAKK